MTRADRVRRVLALAVLTALVAAAGIASSEAMEGSALGLQRVGFTQEQLDLVVKITRPIGDVALFDVYIPQAEDGIALWIEEYERGEAVSRGGRLISTPEHVRAAGEVSDDGTYKSEISVWINDFTMDGSNYLRFILSLGDSSFSLYREITGLDPTFRAFRSQPASLEMLKAGPIPLAVHGAYAESDHRPSKSETIHTLLGGTWQTSKESIEEVLAQYDRSFVVYAQLLGPDDWELRREFRLMPDLPAE